MSHSRMWNSIVRRRSKNSDLLPRKFCRRFVSLFSSAPIFIKKCHKADKAGRRKNNTFQALPCV
jgi:hypothetical protein